MEEDPEFLRVAQELELKGQQGMTKQERQRRQRALDKIGKLDKVYLKVLRPRINQIAKLYQTVNESFTLLR
jgi:hypothetical protein